MIIHLDKSLYKIQNKYLITQKLENLYIPQNFNINKILSIIN
jgi:hypothetical protein